MMKKVWFGLLFSSCVVLADGAPHAVGGVAGTAYDARIPVPACHFARLAQLQNRLCQSTVAPPMVGMPAPTQQLLRGMRLYYPDQRRAELCRELNQLFRVVE